MMAVQKMALHDDWFGPRSSTESHPTLLQWDTCQCDLLSNMSRLNTAFLRLMRLLHLLLSQNLRSFFNKREGHLIVKPRQALTNDVAKFALSTNISQHLEVFNDEPETWLQNSETLKVYEASQLFCIILSVCETFQFIRSRIRTRRPSSILDLRF